MHSTGTNYTVHSITGNPKTCGFGKLICSLMTNDIACYIIHDITSGGLRPHVSEPSNQRVLLNGVKGFANVHSISRIGCISEHYTKLTILYNGNVSKLYVLITYFQTSIASYGSLKTSACSPRESRSAHRYTQLKIECVRSPKGYALRGGTANKKSRIKSCFCVSIHIRLLSM